MKNLNKLSLALALGLTFGSAHAAMVTFNGQSQNAGFAPFAVSSGGLDFAVGGDFYGGIWDSSSPNSNGTDNFIYSSSPSAGALTITKTGGGLFSLNSIEMAISWYDSNPTENILVNGNLLQLTQSLTTYNLNLSNVSAVTITGFGSGVYWMADNIVYDSNRVPEPGTLALLGLGLAGLASSMRRKQ
jgi:hypothetical protein